MIQMNAPRDFFLSPFFFLHQIFEEMKNRMGTNLGPNLLNKYLWHDCYVHTLYESLWLKA